jgi:long-subunit fatty acid transport protein
MMRITGRTIAAFATALVWAPAAASAGGLYVPGAGPQAQARAGAFTAKADDPSALFHNPAGFAKQTGTVILVGANFLGYSLAFQRTGAYEDASGVDLAYEGDPYPEVKNESSPAVGLGSFQAVPMISVSTDFGLELPVRFGFGLMSPHAYPNRDFLPDYEFQAAGVAPPPQRYDNMDTEAMVVLPSVAVAYRVTDQIDVGARLSWGFADIKATSYVWGIRNYEEWIARDGVFHLEITDKFVPAFGFGALYRPTPAFEFGASYSSAANVDGKGTGTAVLGGDLTGIMGEQEEVVPVDDEYAQCAPGGTPDALKACLALTLAQTATVGGRWILRDVEGGERADVEFNVKWENWSSGADFHVIVDGESSITGIPLNETYIRHGYQDVFSFRLGGSYALPVAQNKLILRAGGAYDTRTAPLNYQRVDQDGSRRATLAAGLAYETAKLRIDLGGGFVFEPEREVVNDCNPVSSDEGCIGDGTMTPQADRESPDPIAPIVGPNNQFESPYNAGTYNSHYLLFSLGATYQF